LQLQKHKAAGKMLLKNCFKKVLTGFLFFISLFITSISCDSTEPPPPPDETKPTLTLTIDDASCTDAWLQLTTKDLTLPAQLTLKQYNSTGDSVTQTFSLSTQDSLLYIDSLLPNQTYQYQVSSIQYQVSSIKEQVTTMDTTSHNFTFTSWTFGTIGSSTLYDVAIINENNIWAVGEIMIADTSINSYTVYNAVHWDGNDWELKQIPYYFNSQAYYHPIQSVFAFNENDIWFCGNGVMNWDGTNFRSIGISPIVWGPYQMNKIWGSDNSNLYIVGNNGSIAHYNGTNWQRIESGTTLNINDIWGDFNEKTQEWEVLAVAFNYPASLDKEIFMIRNNSVQNIPTLPIMWPISTIWFVSNKQYYVAGVGIYQKRLIQDGQWKNGVLDLTTFTTTSIRGNNANDVIGVGAFGDFLHFNGVSWKIDYQEPFLDNGSYTKVKIKGDLVVAVGGNNLSINSEAVILIGRR
jgi:hypothetical protein